MYNNKIFKNYQINMGNPFQVRTPINYNTIRKLEQIEESNLTDTNEDEFDFVPKESHEEIISKAKEEAELIIKEANFEAQRLAESAVREIESNRLTTEEEAKFRGYEDGIREAQRQYEDLIKEAELTRESARMEYKEVLANIEADTIDVILDIAKNVIGVEISFNKEDVLYLVRQAFEKCANKENIVLKISGEDYDYVIQNKNRLLSMVEGVGNLEIKMDPALKVGACLLETPYGSVDAGIQTKLKKIEEAFRQAIGK